jgi:hypothetical protein
MDYTKELLLAGSTAIMAAGVGQITQDVWTGVVLIVISCLLFVGRGFYKKYIE